MTEKGWLGGDYVFGSLKPGSFGEKTWRGSIPTPNTMRKSKKTEHRGDASDVNDRGAESQTLLVSVLDCIVAQFVKRCEQGEEAPSPSIADLVRIVQLRRELMPEEQVREIEVKWVESSGTDG